MSLEQLVHGFVGAYVRQRLEGKYGLRWDAVKSDEARKYQYNEKKARVAKDAFYAIRSRSGGDFVSYFTSTLASVPQFLREQDYVTLARALRDRTEDVRALTLLSLSAHSWTPSSNQRSDE